MAIDALLHVSAAKRFLNCAESQESRWDPELRAGRLREKIYTGEEIRGESADLRGAEAEISK